MKMVKKDKSTVSTKRGRWHKHKLFTVTLVLDPTLNKLDSNTIRKKRDIIDKKKVRIEKKNADPEYFRSVIYDNFPRLSGQEFNMWRMSGEKPELVPLPADINNAVALCSTEELKRSHLYIKPMHAAVVALDVVLTATTVKPELDSSAQNFQSTNHQNVHQDEHYNENDDINDDDLPSLPSMVTEINSSQPEPSSLSYTSTPDIPFSSETMSVYASLGYEHFSTYEQPLIYTAAAQSNASLTGIVDAKTSGTRLVENKAQLPYMKSMSVGSFQKLLADQITPVQYILSHSNFMTNDAPASSNPVFPSSYFTFDQIIRNGVPDIPNANQVNLFANKTDVRDIVVQSSHPLTSASSRSNMPARRLKTDPHSQNSNQHQINVVHQEASITNGLYTCQDIRAISCGICLKNLPVELITLPCLELFCLNCLEGYIHETLLPSCPICQTYFQIPDGGLKDMPYNSFFEKVVELRRIANQEASDKLCEVCSKECTLSSIQGAANILLAESYCLDCHEKFCKSCTKCHRSMKMARHHNMVALGLKSSDQVYNMWKQKEQFCKNHMKEVQKIHCHDCEQLVCLQCHEQKHSQHDCTFFNEMAEDTIKQELQSNTENLMKDININENNIDVMTNDCNQRAKDLEMAREGIKWKVAKVKSEIDHCEIELMLYCDEYQTNYIDKTKFNLEQRKQLLSKYRRLAGFMKLLKDLGSGIDLIRFNPTIRQKTNNILSTDFAFWPDKLQRLEFTPSDVTTDIGRLVGLLRLKPALEETCDTAALQSQNIRASCNDQKIKINSNTTTSVAGKANTIAVGHVALISSTSATAIDVKSLKENNLGCNSFLGVLHSKAGILQLKLLKIVPLETCLYRMAELSGRIYFINSLNSFKSSIKVCDSKSFERFDDIDLKKGRSKLYRAKSIIACTINKCLYIGLLDIKLNKPRILRITVQEAICNTWLSHKKIDVYNYVPSLAVTSDGRVLLCYDSPPSLKIYSYAALLLNVVPLPTDMCRLSHTVESLSGNYIIFGDSMSSVRQMESSYGERKPPDRSNESPLSCMIREVTVEGQVIRSFTGGADGGVLCELIYASEIFASPVSEDGRVYFVDWFHDKVWVIDSMLSHCQLLLSEDKDDVGYPQSVLYSRDNKQLIVIHKNKEFENHLSVYQVEMF